jgi:hypothetical protein
LRFFGSAIVELRWYQGTMRRDLLPEPEGGSDAATEEEEEKWVRCLSCAGNVAREAARVAVSGAHLHDFMNPAGLRFRVVCFSAAPGCVGEGERSTVWTWFPGYAWQIELCRACGAHLGWSFHAATTFYGLVADRISGA